MTKSNKRKPIGYIYKITSPEGREYVGLKKSSVFVESYWSSSQNKEFWKDIEKFTKKAFKREILEWCYTLEELNKREQYWITHSNALVDKGGYNICISFPQMVWTDEMRKKNGERKKEYYSHIENRIKHSNATKNSKLYQESRKIAGPKISNVINIKLQDPSFKANKYAFTQTEEFKSKQSENNTGKHWYNNGKINICAKECPEGYIPGMLETTRKGKEFTKEHKKALSEARKGKNWYTDGTNNVFDYTCPDGWWSGRTMIVDMPKQWWNNGKKNIKSVECPGDGWTRGKLNSFDIDISNEDLALLYEHNTLYKLAKMFNTTISKMKCLLKRRSIIKE